MVKSLVAFSRLEWDVNDKEQHARVASSGCNSLQTNIQRGALFVPDVEFRAVALNVLLIAHDHRPAYCVPKLLGFQPTRILDAIRAIVSDAFPSVKTYIGERAIVFMHNSRANLDDMKIIGSADRTYVHSINQMSAHASYTKAFGKLMGYIDPTMPQDGPTADWFHDDGKDQRTHLWSERLPKAFEMTAVLARAANIRTILSRYVPCASEAHRFVEILYDKTLI